MKKALLNLGTVLNKSEQREINGGRGGFVACGCSADYRLEGANGACSFAANGTAWGDPFPGGRCLGSIQNGLCCL